MAPLGRARPSARRTLWRGGLSHRGLGDIHIVDIRTQVCGRDYEKRMGQFKVQVAIQYLQLTWTRI